MMETKDKVKEKEVKFIEVECLRDTASGTDYYEKGKIYSLKEDHPCLEYFKKL